MQQVERVRRGRGFRHWLIDVPANRAQCQVPLISLPLTEKRKERESTGAKSSRWSSNAPDWAGWQTDTRLGWCCLGNPSLLDEVVVCLAVTLTYSQKQFSKLLKDVNEKVSMKRSWALIVWFNSLTPAHRMLFMLTNTLIQRYVDFNN